MLDNQPFSFQPDQNRIEQTLGGMKLSSTGRVSAAYAALMQEGVLSADGAQQDAAALLDDIAQKLEALDATSSGLSGFFKSRKAVPMGAYIWGDVGRGKSMLMDLFFAEVKIEAKRRVHFHEFMDEMHTAIAAFRTESKDHKGARDPIPAVIKPILKTTRLLCFDEFHVNDITNAMLLQRLFEKLFAAGVVVVATSNVDPDQLYKDGLNRQLFVPFIGLLKQKVSVLELVADKDYRRDRLSDAELFHFGDGGADAMDAVWRTMSHGQGKPGTIESLGRNIPVPEEAMGAARFDFEGLCETPLGARDYLKIANSFHALVIDGVPQFDRARSNAAKRFILLVDTLYEKGVKLAASFAVPLENLGADDKTAFEFQRCISRLMEMQSEAYLAAPRQS